jgi:LysM repeat protein
MDRRKIILIAISVNAVLLVLLFMTALPREEEGRVDLANNYALESKSFMLEQVEAPVVPLPAAELQQPLAEKEVVHQLPPLLAQPEVSSLPVLPPIATLPPPSVPVVQGAEVVVKKGDTLEKIAKIHKTTIDEILRINQLSSTFLRVGQVLKVPGAKQKAESATTKDVDYYVVKVGDTPWTIAQKHRMKVDDLLKLNNLNSEKARRLKPGDRLKVR